LVQEVPGGTVGLLRILRDEDTITEGDMQNMQVRFGEPRDVDAITKRDMQKINDLMERLGASKNTYRYPNAMWRSRWSRTPLRERQCHYEDLTKSHLSFNTILSLALLALPNTDQQRTVAAVDGTIS
jgi:hypothetical protein